MRPFTSLTLVFACLLLLGVPLLADEPADPEAPAAPKQPSAAEVNRLIGQLGASDFATREKASRDLLRIGEPARKALERTMKESENMEARWRAEQILRRLDREGEKPMGRPGAPAPETQLPPLPPMPDGLAPPRNHGDLQKLLDELLRGRMRHRNPFGKPHVLEAPGLKLEIESFGPLATVDLHVAGRMGYFFGRSLEDVLRMHPELEKLEGMPVLKEKWAAFKKENPRLFPFDDMPFGTTFAGASGGSGVTITQTPTGVKVVIREKDEDGNVVENTYEGESLEAIRREHPEIADKLKITISFGPLVLPPNRRGGPRLPVPPAPSTPPAMPPEPPPAEPAFGVGLDPVETVLAHHLQLEPGHGALVRHVVPRSMAQTIGIERHDVIVAIDERPVTAYQQAVDTLRRAGRDRTPVTLPK